MLGQVDTAILQQLPAQPEPLRFLRVLEGFLVKVVVVDRMLLPAEKFHEAQRHQQ